MAFVGGNNEGLIKRDLGVGEHEEVKPGGSKFWMEIWKPLIVFGGKGYKAWSESDGREAVIGNINGLGDGFAWFDHDANQRRVDRETVGLLSMNAGRREERD